MREAVEKMTSAEREKMFAIDQRWPMKAARTTLKRLLASFVLRFFDIKVKGLEHLPKHGEHKAFLLTPNHTSHMDTVSLLAALSLHDPELLESIRIMGAADYFFVTPLKSYFMRNFVNGSFSFC